MNITITAFSHSERRAVLLQNGHEISADAEIPRDGGVWLRHVSYAITGAKWHVRLTSVAIDLQVGSEYQVMNN